MTEKEYGKHYAKQYAHTAWFLLKKAVGDLFGQEAELFIEFCLGGNYYTRIPGRTLTAEEVEALKKRMKADVEKALPIVEKSMRCSEASMMFRREGKEQSARAVHYRSASRINITYLGKNHCYISGEVFGNTAMVPVFDLIPYDEGMLLVLPKEEHPEELNAIRPAGELFRVQQESQAWADRLGLTSITDFNDRVVAGKAEDVILMQEAFFEKRLGDVAQTVVGRNKKFVLLSGPSSSGKTTTAYRLAIQLRALGVTPVALSADNWFKEMDQRPLLPDGSPDLESVAAVDTDLFNRDMEALLNGEEIELPVFNFQQQKREYTGKKFSLSENTVVIVEGIHCLNPAFSEKIPDEDKMKIYVSALTPLCLDSMNPISTSDCRLLRRIVRDNRTRGNSAAKTLSLWRNVRDGEEANIFPYQEEADVIINSAMIYELAVLKTYVEPLLYGIADGEPEYGEARRLLRFLGFVLPLPSEVIPATSLVREFIGGACIET